MKVCLKNIVFELCIMMPLLYTIFYMLNEGNANKVVICYLALVYALLLKQLMKKGRRMAFFLVIFGTLFYIIYTTWTIYLQYIFHSYFYTYLLSIILFVLFSDKEIQEDFYLYFIKAKKRFLLYSAILALLIIYTILSGIGLKKTISAMPVLYGPFSIPHYLSYILLVIYCAFYLQYKNSSKKLISYVCRGIIAICILWTAVRSTAIALLILIVYEFSSIKSFEKKTLITALSVIIILYLLLETNILTHNPIVEKTIYAASNNGSITNNREWFRRAALSYYKNDLNLFKQIFGAGMPNLVEAINKSVGAKIHAHNDYVNMLVGYGLVGLIAFVVTQLRLVDFRENFWVAVFLQTFIFVLAYTNGFALYTMLTSSMPIIILFFEHAGGNNIKENQGNKRIIHVKFL